MAGEINFGLLDLNGPAKVGNAFYQGQQEAEQQKQALMQNKLNELYRSATGADGTIDTTKLYSGAAQAGLGSRIPTIQKSMADAKTAQLTQHKAEIDQHLQNFEVVGRIMSGVKDQATYDQARQQVAQTLGPEAVANMPPVYDPATIETNRQQALPVKDQLAQASKEIEDKLKAIQTRDTGGSIDTMQIDPSTGTVKVINSVKKTQSPDSRAADARQAAYGGGVDLSTPEGQQELDYWATVVRKGGNLPTGLARGKDGSAFVREVTKRAALGDTTPDDLMNNQAEFGGKKAGQTTLGKRQAQIEMAATEAYNIMPIAVKASDAVDRTSYPTLNKVLLAADKGSGDANVVQLAVATNSLVNAYTRAISPTGNPTMNDKEHAREILDKAFSKGQYAAAVDMMKKEIEAARQSPNQVRADMRGSTAPQAAPALPSGWSVQVH